MCGMKCWDKMKVGKIACLLKADNKFALAVVYKGHSTKTMVISLYRLSRGQPAVCKYYRDDEVNWFNPDAVCSSVVMRDDY